MYPTDWSLSLVNRREGNFLKLTALFTSWNHDLSYNEEWSFLRIEFWLLECDWNHKYLQMPNQERKWAATQMKTWHKKNLLWRFLSVYFLYLNTYDLSCIQWPRVFRRIQPFLIYNLTSCTDLVSSLWKKNKLFNYLWMFV